MRVLVVEDQRKMLDLLARGLGAAGHTVDCATNGPDALDRALNDDYDAVVLDVMLPDLDGIEVVRHLRAAEVWCPVLMLTARDAVTDRVRGLDAGADDYLVKPFAFAELLSRLRALMRRGAPPRPAVLRCGPLRLDPASHLVTCHGFSVELSVREFSVLEFLLRHQGEVVSRGAILKHVWEQEYDGGSNVVDVYMKYLRDKIDRRFGIALIHTIRGAGYRLDPSGTP